MQGVGCAFVETGVLYGSTEQHFIVGTGIERALGSDENFAAQEMEHFEKHNGSLHWFDRHQGHFWRQLRRPATSGIDHNWGRDVLTMRQRDANCGQCRW
jgi:hypothetical protein